MNNLNIKETKNSPSIIFNEETKGLIIKGRSIPTNAMSVYEDVIAWVNDYCKNSNKLDLIFELEYFNTSSHKYIFEIIKIIHLYNNENEIEWRYFSDDDDMLEIGKKIELLSGASLKFVELEEE